MARNGKPHDIVGATEQAVDAAGGKFAAVMGIAGRTRQITSYFGQLGDGLGTAIPPQVSTTARQNISIATEEIAAGVIEVSPPEPTIDRSEPNAPKPHVPLITEPVTDVEVASLYRHSSDMFEVEGPGLIP